MSNYPRPESGGTRSPQEEEPHLLPHVLPARVYPCHAQASSLATDIDSMLDQPRVLVLMEACEWIFGLKL